MSPRPFHTVKKINDSESHSELIERDLEVKKKSETGNINNDRKSWIEQSGGLIRGKYLSKGTFCSALCTGVQSL